ncbi:MAG TPA: endolytic transglycosylase MltG [Blastocatellia bacterium]|nr:endolytic transglycosylase MltG [Blastocatellia bacterium]
MLSGSLIKKTAIALVAILILLGVGGWFWLKSAVNRPRAHNAAEKLITIEPRTSTGAIIAKLHREGVLAGEWPTWLWMKLAAHGQNFKTGTYQFESPISPLKVIGKLTRGEVATVNITFPEGFNQWDIAAKLAAPLPGMKQPPPASQDEILDLFKKKVGLISDLDPQARDLEGYLFPDTYEYMVNTTREQLVEAMVKRFRRVYTPELQEKARALGMNTRQAITMASLVEKEARIDAERETISQVYHKRWKMGEKLACDPTVIYAAHLVGKGWDRVIHRSDLDRNSPYNTYLRAGLPPGPIASPGKRSIEAALNPAGTNYLYFVRDSVKNDGSHVFSENSRDHDRAVARYREWERQEKNSQPAATPTPQAQK